MTISNPSLPEKPKSLADEIEPLLWSLADAATEWGHAQAVTSAGSDERGKAVNETYAAVAAVKSRLLAIESELNDLRKENQLWVPRPSIGGGSTRTIVPPRVESHNTLVNGLTTGLIDEDDGN